MTKWLNLYGKQYLGFWALGLVLFVLQEIPYIIMPLFHPEKNPIMNMQESSLVLEVCEKILGVMCIVLMTFVVHGDAGFFSIKSGKEKLFFCVAMGILLMNFGGWYLYFTGHQSLAVMMIFIVALPPLYYVFIGLWRENIPLVAVGIAFLVVHFVHVLGNLKMG